MSHASSLTQDIIVFIAFEGFVGIKEIGVCSLIIHFRELCRSELPQEI